MAKNKDPRFINEVGFDKINLQNGAETDSWEVPSGSGGVLITSLNVTSDDVGLNVDINILNASDTVIGKLGLYAIPANAGTDGTEPAFDLKAAMSFLDTDAAGNPILLLKEGDKLQADASASGITALKNVNINIGYGSYEED